MTRDHFRESVFKRDSNKCIICGRGPENGIRIDSHHIIERRLWLDGGYYLDNGATLCGVDFSGCHAKAESTIISVEKIRQAAGITNIVLPEDMYSDHVYDKWGNVILGNGTRTKGPLFHDESVQKILKLHPNFNAMFVDYVKYPRTFHLPWSPGVTEDDRILKNISVFENKRVIVTEKMDGENFSGYRDYCHARSVDGGSHYTRNWAKNFWMQRSFELPQGWRICAENLYAVHSIAYKNLDSYLLGFSIWNEKNECLSWDETVEWFFLLNMQTVSVIYDGIWDENKIKKLYDESSDKEGYVVRLADKFNYSQFKFSMAKFVRKNHVQTQKHWFYGSNNHAVNQLK